MEIIASPTDEYIKKYLEGKTIEEELDLYLLIDQDKNNFQNPIFLDIIIGQIKTELRIYEERKKSERDIEEIDAINSILKRLKSEIQFLSDLKTFKVLFEKKEIFIDYPELISDFSQCMYNDVKTYFIDI